MAVVLFSTLNLGFNTDNEESSPSYMQKLQLRVFPWFLSSFGGGIYFHFWKLYRIELSLQIHAEPSCAFSSFLWQWLTNGYTAFQFVFPLKTFWPLDLFHLNLRRQQSQSCSAPLGCVKRDPLGRSWFSHIQWWGKNLVFLQVFWRILSI